MNRTTGGVHCADSLRGGFLALRAIAITALAVVPSAAARAQAVAPVNVELYLNAFANLDRHEMAALGLTLGILLFAVVTSIMLVRTRQRAAATEIASRDEIGKLTAEIDRVNALLLSEPQIVVAWAAGSDEPDIVGDVTIVTLSTMPQRVLAFGSWLPPEQAQIMEQAAGRAARQWRELCHDAEHARQQDDRGRRPCDWRAGGDAAARCQRHKRRACGAERAP